ncbi:hypothetical protein BDN72DRAFT_121330 [Pluteus cervinus]|uniref:Uncharacterized protein n=1 Tax=Pluteus cervinus TaxID=181527 RepID=A0ACD3B7G7_9AGAR|nr:hypothetical protein BDN72DRAFT_121330 [Pluteus cervinus]
MVAQVLSRCFRCVRLALVLYILVAVLYTTHHLFFNLVCTAFKSLVSSLSSPGNSWLHFPFSRSSTYELERPSILSDSTEEHTLFWESVGLSPNGELLRDKVVPVNAERLLSKAFANTMRPSKIVPYYYKATGVFSSDAVTITTLITSDRFTAFSRLVERYQGPISVTIHVHNIKEHLQELLHSLHDLYISSDKMSKHVDVHLVLDSFDRQFNAWRNIARFFARTDFVMMLDIDFYICTDFQASILGNKSLLEKLREGHTALVIPAFEYANYREGTNPAAFPRSKRDLLGLVKSKHIRVFHSFWVPGHNNTDYEKYYSAQPGDIYKVTTYQSNYEPYVIFKKEGPPWCDERFIGYGGNKAACLFEMYLSGVSFYVLADHFIVHQNHLYEEQARKHERAYNRKVWIEFQEETCLRYIKNYNESGLIATPLANNLRDECKKKRRVRKLVAPLLDT